MTKLRWGILGVAKINERLLPAVARAANAEVVAIASRSLDRAREAARRWHVARAHGSYEALLEDPDIDAIYNPLPNTLHDEWTRKAADHGKHVLCEKPLCPSAAAARALVAYCRGKGVKLMDGFMWPHHPRTKKIREVLDAGTIGVVQHVTGTFTFLLPLDAHNIRLQQSMAGGGLLDVGCYPVYGIRWAFGAEPVRVWATAQYLHGVDVHLHGVVWLADGRTGTFDTGFTLPLRQHFEIAGTKGMLRIPDMWIPPERATFEVTHLDGNRERFTIAGQDQILHMIEGFSAAVQEGGPVEPAPEEAVKTLAVLDALARSAREGREVEIGA
jgi:predicted dehydrogenase